MGTVGDRVGRRKARGDGGGDDAAVAGIDGGGGGSADGAGTDDGFVATEER